MLLRQADHPQGEAKFALSAHFSGRRAALATMHGKEAAIAPAFRDRLGLVLETPQVIDTDALGTFTGEIPRVGSMRKTAIAKARLGMAATGLALLLGRLAARRLAGLAATDEEPGHG